MPIEISMAAYAAASQLQKFLKKKGGVDDNAVIASAFDHFASVQATTWCPWPYGGKHELVDLIGGPACRKCGWTP